ncbi:cytochrome P450 [Myxococcus xanthus]|uniref:cytochrome P450 n=1 Tax=Myxococcus xanthus TaxID=34 RepID=UPI0011274A14|nr:cytochrome P450 [Myxococcus xanthus]QDE97181.1 hypothetical protein BHS05_15760 [Myxococcus xanthus]QDF04741.1 hypothetical protein BHS04_16255 [Myxococcus xanthus]
MASKSESYLHTILREYNDSPTGGLRRRQAPGPGYQTLPRMMYSMARGGMEKVIRDLWTRYGDLVRLDFGVDTWHMSMKKEHFHYVFVENRNNYIKGKTWERSRLVSGYGLTTSNTELWKRQRRLMDPAYSRESLLQFTPAIAKSVEVIARRWEKAARDGSVIDVSADMRSVALDVITTTLLGGIGEHGDELHRDIMFTMDYASPASVELPLGLGSARAQRFIQAMARVDGVINGMIRQRRGTSGCPFHDLLDLLIHARDEDNKTGMSDELLRDEVLAAFYAGHETTATSMAWTWFLLAQNPEAYERLMAEVDQSLTGDHPTRDDLDKLNFAEAVFYEGMRLYPPGWMIPRDVALDDELDGYHIPAGSRIVLVPFLINRHPQYWDAPEEFRPQRYLDDSAAYAFVAFGGGPRMCIGRFFGVIEAQVVLALLTRRFRIEYVGVPEPKRDFSLTLRPGPLLFKVHERRAA